MIDGFEPIKFEWKVDLRPSDLDPYHHVSSYLYLEYVIGSRWQYLAKHYGEDAFSLAEKGLGFFLTKSQMKYRRGITDAKQILVRSYVSECYRNNRLVDVPFEIQSVDEMVTFCNGILSFAVMNVSNTRVPKIQPLPDWAFKYFFSPSPA